MPGLPHNIEGQSQFAPLKLRSLALAPSSGARCAPPNSTYGSSTVRLFPMRRALRSETCGRSAPRFAHIRKKVTASSRLLRSLRLLLNRQLAVQVSPPPPPGAIIAREPQCRCDRRCPESAYINIIPSGLNKHNIN